MRKILPMAAILGLLVHGPAFAHARLLSATPAPNAAVAPVDTVRLSFSERLIGQFSGADVTATALPGKQGGGRRVPGTASLAPDGRSLVVHLERPLTVGSYRLDYHVVSTDTHRVQGGYVFRVR